MSGYHNLTLAELKTRCREAGLRYGGNAKTLIARLVEHDAAVEAENARFRVYIHTLMGKVITIYCDPATTIGDLKHNILEETGVSEDKQTLFLHCHEAPVPGDLMFSGGMTGKKMTDGTLIENGVYNGGSIHLHISLR
jgi:hypothetical protein